ncbi:carbonic anhydrase 6 [Thomomys bottae]
MAPSRSDFQSHSNEKPQVVPVLSPDNSKARRGQASIRGVDHEAVEVEWDLCKWLIGSSASVILDGNASCHVAIPAFFKPKDNCQSNFVEVQVHNASRGPEAFSELLKEGVSHWLPCFQLHTAMRASVALVLLLFLGAQAQHGAEWTYSEGTLDEEHWVKEYPDCGGQQQSPINLQRRKVRFNPDLQPLELTGYGNSHESSFPMTNNGHTVQISLPPTMQLTASDGTVYKAIQMHYHWGGASSEVSGSEHTIDGIRRVIEMHLVHYNAKYESYDVAKDKPDGLAVLAAFVEIEEYAENTYYSVLISHLANIRYPGQTTNLTDLDILDMLPGNLYHYYTYHGSLTTPPCTENVRWFVMSDSVKISKAQVFKIENSVVNHNNQTLHNGYRKTQALHSRVVEANFPYFPNSKSQSQYYFQRMDSKLDVLLRSLAEERTLKRKRHH